VIVFDALIKTMVFSMHQPPAIQKNESERSSYTLKAMLGAGGMGVTYLALYEGAEGFQKQVVLKKLPSQWSQSPELMRSLVNEALISVQCNHPNIVSIWSFERLGNEYGIAMEYVEGCPLSALWRDPRGVAPEVLLYVVMQVLLALDYAHNLKNEEGEPMRLVHRDISPDNILLSRQGHVKLADFGLARFRDQLGQTQPGTIKGKFGYLSPEQARGESVDHRSDLYTLGILLYEGLTGQSLFQREQTWQALQAAMMPRIAPIQERIPQIDPLLAKIIHRALETDPARRYPHARAFFDALEAYLLPQTQEKLRRITAHRVREQSTNPSQSAQEAAALHSNSAAWSSPSSEVSNSLLFQGTRRQLVYVLAQDSVFEESLCRALADPWKTQTTHRIEILQSNEQVMTALQQFSAQQRVPAAVIFGGLHVAIEHPFLQALKPYSEIHKILVLGEPHPEILEMAIELCGVSALISERPTSELLFSRLKQLERGSLSLQRLELLQRQVEESSLQEEAMRNKLSALADANLHATQIIEELQIKNTHLEEQNIRLEYASSSAANVLGIPPEQIFLQGDLRQFSLLQLLHLLRHQKGMFCTHFVSPEGTRQALLYSQKDEILEIRCGEYFGEEALDELLSWDAPRFFVCKHHGGITTTMSQSIPLSVLSLLHEFKA
jgi:serine/threonine-protein kinase